MVNDTDVASVLWRLAEIAQVPEQNAAAFIADVLSLLSQMPRWHAGDLARRGMGKVSRELEVVREVAEKLQQVLGNLSEEARQALGVYGARQHQFGNAPADPAQLRMQVIEVLELAGPEAISMRLALYDNIAAEIAAAAGTDEWPSTPDGGRPSASLEIAGNPHAPAVDLVISELIVAAGRHCGALTLDKNRGTGSLISALAVLRPFLPPGWSPPAFSRLQRLKTAAQKRVNRTMR